MEKWKALAKVENRRAKENWDAVESRYVPPKFQLDPEGKKARAERNAQINIWASDGMSTRDICARIGLNDSTVNRIIRSGKLAEKEAREAREASEASEACANADQGPA